MTQNSTAKPYLKFENSQKLLKMRAEVNDISLKEFEEVEFRIKKKK